MAKKQLDLITSKIDGGQTIELQMLDKPCILLSILQEPIEDYLRMWTKESVQESLKDFNFQPNVEYYKEFYNLELTGTQLKDSLVELVTSTRVEVMKAYLYKNLEEFIFQSLESFIDEAGLMIDDNMINKSETVEYSAFAGEVQEKLVKSYAKQVKNRLSCSGGGKKAHLSLFNLLTRVLPAYRKSIKTLRALDEGSYCDLTSEDRQLIEDGRRDYPENPDYIACYRVIKTLRLSYSTDELKHFYNLLKDAMKAEECLLQNLQAKILGF